MAIENLKPGDNFTCSILYNGNYYNITINVYNYSILEDEGYGIITHGSYDNFKILTLDPKHFDIWHPFNNIIFVNELDNKVRITIFYNDQI